MNILLALVIAVVYGVLGGIWGAEGGASHTSKLFRRLLIPLWLMLTALLVTHNFWVVTIMSMMGALSLGYGIPSETDKGSALGRFALRIANNNHQLADEIARGIIGAIIALSLISVAIIKGNWLPYILCSIGICLVNGRISWRSTWGQITFYGKQLNRVDLVTWGLITALATLIILL